MSSHIQSTIDPNDGFCTMSNAGVKPYRIVTMSTTGYIAVRGDDASVSVRSTLPAPRHVIIPASDSIKLWACANIKDPTPAGEVFLLDASNNALTKLDVSKCTSLTELECRRNQLRSLDLTPCKNLRVVDCSANQLAELRLAGLKQLYTLDCSKNRLESIDFRACGELAMGDGRLNCTGNPLSKVTVTGAQLENGLLSGQLGNRGTAYVVCGRSFRSWARNLAKGQLPAAWKIELS